MPPPSDPIVTTTDRIYRTHSAFVWRVARARGVPIASIPDLLQEVFITVLRRLPTYREQGSLKGWLYTIADAHILQFFRSEGRRARRMKLFSSEPPRCDAGYELDEHLQRSEAARLVQQFIDESPTDAREVFLLCCVEGMPGVDVARLLGININTLYSREAAARRRFQSFIQRVHNAEERTP